MNIHYATNGKRDFHDLERMFDERTRQLHEACWEFDENRKLVLDYISQCRFGVVKSAGRSKRVQKSSLYRITGILELLSEKWLRKSFKSTNKEDWTTLYMAMEDDVIRNISGKPFKRSTKAKNYKTIQKFLRWLQLEQFCDNWDTTEEIPTRDVLTRHDVERMIVSASPKLQCYVMMLFDGGFRSEEFANLRWNDLRKEDEGFYRANVRKETSKTKNGRIVSLWLSTDFIDTLKSMEKCSAEYRDDDFIYKSNYHSLLKTVVRLGHRTLGRAISPHIFRHSSATYYAGIIKTYQNFCFRYGWSLKSSTPQRYWHPTSDQEIADQTKEHEIARFKTEFERVKLQNDALREEIRRLQQDMETFKQKFAEFFITSGEADKIYDKYEKVKRRVSPECR